jgi:hypothetical protein
MANPSKPAEKGTQTFFTNARVARRELREVYGRYALGKDRYPRGRILTPAEVIPPRVRPIAALIIKAWQIIDLDNEYFWDMVTRTSEALNKSSKDEVAGLVVAKSGINAVQFGKVSVQNGETNVMHGVFTPAEAQELVNGIGLTAGDGNLIRFSENGELVVPPVPDAVILRDRPHGAASFYGPLSVISEAA